MEVNNIIKNISENLKQKSVNKKDETAFMKAMLNDTSYEVDIYNNKEVIGTFNPSKAARENLAIGISAAAKVSMAEAQSLADNHTFGNKEAENQIGISKQFILGYTQTGRKIRLGGRENVDAYISMQQIPAGTATVPDRKDGKVVGTKQVKVSAYSRLKVSSPCPKHLKK